MSYKIVVFGSGAVGKSALTVQFVHGYFIEDYDPTIEDCYKRTFTVDGENVQLDILDTAGQEDFAPMRNAYMHQGKGFIIVYSIDDRESFERVDFYYREICRGKASSDFPLVLVGNKCDLEDKIRQIGRVEGEELARELKASFFETSAKTNVNIENTFAEIIRKIKKAEEIVDPNAVVKEQPKKFKCNLI